LFGEGTRPGASKLVEQRTSACGMVMPTQEPAGPLKTGSFETHEPSAQERKPRER
jgi:hypothetical protein